MENKRQILIPMADVTKIRDRQEASDLEEFLPMYTKNKDILEIKKKILEVIRKSYAELNNRFNLFYGTLFSYWKIIADGVHIAYMYPYRLLETNKHLFCLLSPTEEYGLGHPLEYGMVEHSFDVTEWMLYKDVLFVETTREEMLENSHRMVDICLENRLRKIDENPKYNRKGS